MDQANAIIGKSPAMAALLSVLAKAAPTDSTVIFTGEPGTGKTLLASILHAKSRRHAKPFVTADFAAIPRESQEAEIFGYGEEALAHAPHGKTGLLERAHGGTLFLDAVHGMDATLQAKLARALQEKQFEPIGSVHPQKLDARITAAATADLEQEVAAGRFRADLFYRLNVIPIAVPPLRERGTDVLLLAEAFLGRFCAGEGRKPPMLSSEARNILARYAWPGNVRELQTVMERICVTTGGGVIGPEDLPGAIRHKPGAASAASRPSKQAGFAWPTLADLTAQGLGLKDFLDEIETRLLAETLAQTNGAQSQMAELLKIKRTTLIEKLKKKKLC